VKLTRGKLKHARAKLMKHIYKGFLANYESVKLGLFGIPSMCKAIIHNFKRIIWNVVFSDDVIIYKLFKKSMQRNAKKW